MDGIIVHVCVSQALNTKIFILFYYRFLEIKKPFLCRAVPIDGNPKIPDYPKIRERCRLPFGSPVTETAEAIQRFNYTASCIIPRA